MREKLLQILGGHSNVRVVETELNKTADLIISTLIESLPEERHKNDCLHNFSNCDCGANYKNAYRSEVINLLRGTK